MRCSPHLEVFKLSKVPRLGKALLAMAQRAVSCPRSRPYGYLSLIRIGLAFFRGNRRATMPRASSPAVFRTVLLAFFVASSAAISTSSVEFHAPFRFNPLGARESNGLARVSLARAAAPPVQQNPMEVVAGKIGGALKASQNFWLAAIGGGFAGTVRLPIVLRCSPGWPPVEPIFPGAPRRLRSGEAPCDVAHVRRFGTGASIKMPAVRLPHALVQ